MARQTVDFAGETHEFESKKRMLKVIGKVLLENSERRMTLRQLYYRFVALDLIENKESQYDYLGEAIKEARLQGLIDWDLIEDRTRSTDAGDHTYVDPGDRFERALRYFKNTPGRHKRPRWEGQDTYVEVWVEKEALAGVFADVCEELGVVSFPNRGYSSITLLKEAADRIKSHVRSDDWAFEEARILYFGDFDPSGQDIERNIREKLVSQFQLFADVKVERQALTRDQIDEHELPPQPAKRTDSRYEDFVAEHGDMAVELDALPPEQLEELVRDAVGEHFDQEYYEDTVLPGERSERADLRERVDDALDE